MFTCSSQSACRRLWILMQLSAAKEKRKRRERQLRSLKAQLLQTRSKPDCSKVSGWAGLHHQEKTSTITLLSVTIHLIPIVILGPLPGTCSSVDSVMRSEKPGPLRPHILTYQQPQLKLQSTHKKSQRSLS